MPPVPGSNIASHAPGTLRSTIRVLTPALWQRGLLVATVQEIKGSPTVHCCVSARIPLKVDLDKASLVDSLLVTMTSHLVAVEEDAMGLVEAEGMVIRAMEAEQREDLHPRIPPQPLKVMDTQI
jgi:hypothetical protein